VEYMWGKKKEVGRARERGKERAKEAMLGKI
jgi:hypothetical protein